MWRFFVKPLLFIIVDKSIKWVSCSQENRGVINAVISNPTRGLLEICDTDIFDNGSSWKLGLKYFFGQPYYKNNSSTSSSSSSACIFISVTFPIRHSYLQSEIINHWHIFSGGMQ